MTNVLYIFGGQNSCDEICKVIYFNILILPNIFTALLILCVMYILGFAGNYDAVDDTNTPFK